MSDRYQNEMACGIEPEREGDEPTLEQWRDRCRQYWRLLAWIDEKPECRAAQFRALQDENSILRAALEQFVNMPEKFPEAEFLDGWARMRAAFANAKTVLQPLT